MPPSDDDEGTDDGDEYRVVVKTVAKALGPNPGCDPYPWKEFQDGSDLFEKRYAKEFYAAHPDLVGIPYGVLRRNHAKNPIVHRVMMEYSAKNAEFKERVREWRERWPEKADIVDRARKRETSQRTHRKRRKIVSVAARGEDGEDDNDAPASLPWLTQEFVDSRVKLLDAMYDTALALLAGQRELRTILDEHAAFVRQNEADRGDVF